MNGKDHLLEMKNAKLSELIKDRSEFDCLKKNRSDANGAQGETSKIEYPKNSGQYVCFKSIKNSNDSEYKIKNQIDYFRELENTNRARHPCIAELLYFDLTPRLEKRSLVTRFYAHGSLSSCYTDRSDPYSQWGTKTGKNGLNGTVYTILMYGISRGVKYLHMQHILHRDIKPQNIVIDEFYHPHIIDLGLSKVNLDNEEQSAAVGTRYFMAPEIRIIDGKIKFSYPVDIFALALVFATIVSGKNLILDKKFIFSKSDDEFRQKILELFDVKNQSILGIKSSSKLIDLVEKMLSCNENDRPKIDDICKNLEQKEYWFEGTDEETFRKYQEEINEYEEKQIDEIKRLYSSKDKQNDELTKSQFNSKEQENDYKKNFVNRSKRGQKIYSNYSYKEQHAYLNLSNNNKNSEAEFLLGIYFYNGFIGIQKDYVQAIKFFIKSSQNGNDLADCMIKNILAEIKQKETKAENSCSDSKLEINDDFFKNLKNKEAQLLMGMVYEAYGKYNEAIDYYSKSASQGLLRAKGRIGCLLTKTGQMFDQAEQLLKLASGWNCLYVPDEYEPEGEDYEDEDYELAVIYEDDVECEKKIAMFHLGLLYLNYGDNEKIDHSIEIFNDLLKNGCPDAALALAMAYRKKNDKVNEKKFAKIAYKQFSSFESQNNNEKQ